DIELPALQCYGPPLRRALATGAVDPALVDAAVARVLRMKFQLGLFENPYVDADAAAAVFDTPEQRALARRIAQQSIVLLKNGGALSRSEKGLGSMGVFGPSASSVCLLQGDYHYPPHLESVFGSFLEGNVSPPANQTVNLAQCFVPMVSVLEGIKAR